MDRLGVHTILVSHMQCTSHRVQRGNDEVLAAMREFPGRVLGYVAVSPATGETDAEMARCLGLGFTGLKLHSYSGFSYTDPVYAGVLARANERRLPVLLHTWGTAADFAAVAELASRYPQTSILVAHAGAGNGEAECMRVVRDHANVYLDLALSIGPRGLVARFVDGVGADRVVYGSDCYCFSMTQQIGKVLGADIPDAAKRRILSLTAQRLLARVQR
jgi:predicted TIM-barrel fold metal-dependent hydrolase